MLAVWVGQRTTIEVPADSSKISSELQMLALKRTSHLDAPLQTPLSFCLAAS